MDIKNFEVLSRLSKQRSALSVGHGEDQGHLLTHILHFGNVLRVMGVNVSLTQMLDLAKALTFVPITDRSDFYHTAKTLLVNRHEDFLAYDQAFALFWRLTMQEEKRAKSEDQRVKQPRLPLGTHPREEARGDGEMDWNDFRLPEGIEEKDTQPVSIMIYSPKEALRQKDFREMSLEEIQEAKRAMASLEWRLGSRRTRRYRTAKKGRLDLRRLIRNSLRHAGESVDLPYRERVYRPRPLVVLCDISGSMERYSRILLHFLHMLKNSLKEVTLEAFVFSTRLTRITHQLRYKDVDESFNQLSRIVEDWSGGTRIGEAIKAFNFQWSRRVSGRGAIAMIISDGWDRGDTEVLSREMARLQRSVYRLMWLNPLLGSKDYRPIQRGMVAAMPYIDDFLPVNNFASLEQLVEILSSVGPTRPARRQSLVLSNFGCSESDFLQQGPRARLERASPHKEPIRITVDKVWLRWQGFVNRGPDGAHL